jgi:hypothetical protein
MRNIKEPRRVYTLDVGSLPLDEARKIIRDAMDKKKGRP